MGRLTGSVAIVTGAGQGVGRGIALALAKEGAAVMVVGRTFEKCANTAREIKDSGGRALAMACDISKRDQVEAVVVCTAESLGSINILVNNAQASRPMVPFEETTEKDMAVSLKGMYGSYHFMQVCFPYLKENRGKVINIGSVSGVRGDEGFTSYAIAKEGIRAMSRVAAREWGKHGITVNVLCPFSDSPGIDYMVGHNPGFIPQLTESTALKRLGSSENDVGRTVVFLASSDADYITGQTINVDGGIWIAP